jgi:hypothetical protein
MTSRYSRPVPAPPCDSHKRHTTAALLLLLVSCLFSSSTRAADGLTLSWTNNILRVAGPDIPGGPVEVWWWEAFCKKGSTRRAWNLTTIPHRTELKSVSANGKRLQLFTRVEPAVEVSEDLRVKRDGVEITVTLKNRGREAVDLEWFEPCIRVGRFTSRKQSNYVSRCFIYTDHGLKTLDTLPHNEEALYRGGQVYVPPDIHHDDVNPRPISPVTPVNGIIGCFSADNQYLLATAWERTQHLFQGVIVCVHSDPHLGGLKPGETKRLRGKIYLMRNDPAALLRRYQRDFGVKPGKPF